MTHFMVRSGLLARRDAQRDVVTLASVPTTSGRPFRPTEGRALSRLCQLRPQEQTLPPVREIARS